MAEAMTESFETDDEQSQEWDSEEEPGPRVLWGRVAALAGIVLLAFLIGRATAGDGVPTRDMKRAERQLGALETENEDLRSQVALLETGALDPNAPPAELDGTVALPDEDAIAAETAEGGSENDAGTKVEGLNYVVKQNDSLSKIARKFYGDASLGRFLARANNIADPAAITVGQKIIIPNR
jgi:nucleoid-associated protein YgaU